VSVQQTHEPVPASRETRPVERDLSLPTKVVTVTTAAIVALVWIPSIGRSLWLDELISTWVIDEGFTTAIGRAQEYQASSPLYFGLLWVWSYIVGTNEVVLRLPSIVCVAAALWHVNGLGRDLGSPLVGKIAVLSMVATPTVAQMGLSARPYALLLLVVVLSVRSLLRWTESGELRDGLTTGVLATAALYLHPFSAFVFVAHLIHLRSAMRAGHGPSGRQVVWVGAVAAVLLVPLLPQLAQIAGRSDVYSYARMPDLEILAIAMVPSSAVVLLLVGFGLSLRSKPPVVESVPRYPTGAPLIVAWAVAAPVLLFLLSRLGGSSVFVQRYYMVAVPGAALLVGLLFTSIANLAARFWLLIALSAVVLFAVVDDHPLNGLEHDWRGAIEQANAVVVPDDTTILFSNGLVESNDPMWLADPEARPYLNSVFSRYPADAPTVALPTIYLPENASLVDDAVAVAAASETDTLVVLFPFVPGATEYLSVLDATITEHGYAHEGERDFRGIRVLLYER